MSHQVNEVSNLTKFCGDFNNLDFSLLDDGLM